MVLPGDELITKIKHTALGDGNFVVNVTTISQRGEKVLEGSVEVVRSTTTHTSSGGQATRERFMEMTYDTTDKDGNIKNLLLFVMLQHIFMHPKGLLFATEFTQIIFVITSCLGDT